MKNNQAQLNLNRIVYGQRAALFKVGAILQSDYDQALVNSQRAEAQVNNSLVAISQKMFTLLFPEKLAFDRLILANYVNAGETLVSLQSLNSL